MKEQLITFETAKLAKEKGLDFSNSGYFYDKKGGKILDTPIDKFLWNGKYPAPTQSLLQKWLREKHDIIVSSTPSCLIESDNGGRDGNITTNNKFLLSTRTFEYNIYNKGTWYKKGFSGIGYSYEQALEKGLQEALKLINNDTNKHTKKN